MKNFDLNKLGVGRLFLNHLCDEEQSSSHHAENLFFLNHLCDEEPPSQPLKLCPLFLNHLCDEELELS